MSRSDHQEPFYEGQFNPSYHLELVRDQARVRQFSRAIDATAQPNGLFCELGCGTGIFSIYAAKRFRHVFAIERDLSVLAIAKENARRAGVADKITFIEGDAATASISERADVIFAEMMSIWLITEPQVPICRRAAKDLLKPGGAMIPSMIVNLCELGQYDFGVGDIEIKAPMPEFAGIERMRPITTSYEFSRVDLLANPGDDVNGVVRMKALVAGEINAARLSNVIVAAPGVLFYTSDGLTPTTVVPIAESVTVSLDEEVEFHANYRHRSSIGSAVFSARAV